MALNSSAPQAHRARRRSPPRRRSDPGVFDYLDPPEIFTAVPPKGFFAHSQHHDGRGGYFSGIPEKPSTDAAAPAAGLLKTLTDPLWRFFGSAPLPKPPSPPPPEPRRRRDTRRIHSYSGHPGPVTGRELVLANPPPKPVEGSKSLFSYLPSLPSMPSLSGITLPSIPFLTPTPEPPPQLSLEALDTMIRYLAIYTQHAVSLDSRKTTAKLKRDAEQLIMGMSIHGTQSLHEYLVVLKRTPDVAIAFDSRMLARYTRGDAEAMGVLVEGLGEVLVALAGVLEGGFTVPGRWVDEED